MLTLAFILLVGRAIGVTAEILTSHKAWEARLGQFVYLVLAVIACVGLAGYIF